MKKEGPRKVIKILNREQVINSTTKTLEFIAKLIAVIVAFYGLILWLGSPMAEDYVQKICKDEQKVIIERINKLDKKLDKIIDHLIKDGK